MQTKEKKVLYVILGAIFVAAFFVVLLAFLIQGQNKNISITLFNPITNTESTIRVKKNEDFYDKLRADEVEGYEFLGFYLDNECTIKLERHNTIKTDHILTLLYSKVINGNNVGSINGYKYLTLDDDFVISGVNFEKIIDTKPVYLDLSRGLLGTREIPDNAFFGSNLREVKLAKNCQTIGENAFKNCFNLEKVTFNDGLTEIKAQAFYNCRKLSGFDLPDSLATLGSKVFSACSIENLTLGKELASIENDTFEDLSVKNITLNNENSHFNFKNSILYGADGETLYHYFGSQAEVVVDEATKQIEAGAFKNSAVTSITLPEGLISIGAGAFENSKLKEIEFKNSNNLIINSRAFSGCADLGSIKFAEGLSEIGDEAFKDCSALKSVTFTITSSDGVGNLEKIGGRAFYGCYSLKSISLPDSVTGLGASAFEGCTALSLVELSPSITTISQRLFAGCTSLKEVTMQPEGNITEVENYAFLGCTILESIRFLQGVTTLGDGCFKNCASIREAVFDLVTVLPSECFAGCSMLSVNSFAALHEIKADVFNGCSVLSSFTVTDNLASIDKEAFKNATGLVAFSGVNSNFTTDNGVLYNLRKNAIICYPMGKKDANFTILSTISQILDDGLLLNPYLKTIDVEPENNSFSATGGALYNHEQSLLIKAPVGVSNIQLPVSVHEIGRYAFAFNTAISNITIPESVTKINKGAFLGCTGLTMLTLPFVGETQTTNTFLGYVFGADNVYDLERKDASNEKYIPASLMTVVVANATAVKENSFYQADGIMSLTFNDGVTDIKSGALYGMTSLVNLEFKGAVNRIESSSMVNLSSLRTFKLKFSSNLVIESGALSNIYGSLRIEVGDEIASERSAYIQKFRDVYPSASRWTWVF